MIFEKLYTALAMDFCWIDKSVIPDIPVLYWLHRSVIDVLVGKIFEIQDDFVNLKQA